MSNLTYLNDASVLHNLRQRYYHKLIYVSVNQYEKIADDRKTEANGTLATRSSLIGCVHFPLAFFGFWRLCGCFFFKETNARNNEKYFKKEMQNSYNIIWLWKKNIGTI